jgi:two-component system phosphate regulon response regulator OmpR
MAENALFSETEKPHILVVDDDDRIRQLLSRYLRDNQFVVATAKDAADATDMMKVALFDALIVDVMMPGQTGLEFTQTLRNTSSIPVLLLTALEETSDRISGLEAGADDYLPKPFEPRELLLRLKAILRRRDKIPQTLRTFRLGKWTYDPDLNELVDDAGEKQRLTAVEANLLENLSRHAGKVLNREELARLCGLDGNDRTIDVQVTRLRRKIEDDSKVPRYLQTIRGQGYLLRVDVPKGTAGE